MSFTIVGIGEVLWDLLPGGKQPGGASANFAYHAQTLGAQAWLVSKVGNDSVGRELLEHLRAMQFSVEGIAVDPLAPTGTVAIELSPDGRPQFTIRDNVAWDQITVTDFARSIVAQ